jgi:predicted ATP-dependent serine protease
MFTFPHSPTLPNMFSHCQKCGAILKINEEWHSGRCTDCTQWADVLTRVDTIIKTPIAAPDDFAAIMAWIDSYIEQPYEPPTGVIKCPNRIA